MESVNILVMPHFFSLMFWFLFFFFLFDDILLLPHDEIQTDGPKDSQATRSADHLGKVKVMMIVKT